jgi:predicted nucleotidyltransferase
MVKDENYIREKILEFYSRIKQKYIIKKVFLFGSYAKGNYQQDSDIDVAVVIDGEDPERRIEITSQLYKIASSVDVFIEPKCIFWDEYINREPASILSEIVRTGKVITI